MLRNLTDFSWTSRNLTWEAKRICAYTKHYFGSISVRDVSLDVVQVNILSFTPSTVKILICLLNLFCSLMSVNIETTVTSEPYTENLLCQTAQSKYLQEKQIRFKNSNKKYLNFTQHKAIINFLQNISLRTHILFFVAFTFSLTFELLNMYPNF